MGKELPYFKFTVSEFLLGRISSERDGTKGAFITACAFYWHKVCDVKRSEIEKKIGRTRVELLLNKEYIQEINGYILIPFLDEQFEELSDNKNFNSDNGKKGADKRYGKKDRGAIALREDKDKDKDKDIINWADPLFIELLKKWFSYKKTRRESYKSVESEKAFEKKLKKLSNNDPKTAEEIVENSIASNYAGIFALKGSAALGVGLHQKGVDKVTTFVSQHEEAKKIMLNNGTDTKNQ